MRKIANSFLAAMQFLTRLPVHKLGNPPPEGLAGAVVYFPVVGLVVGGGAVFLNCVLSRLVSKISASSLAIGTILALIPVVSVFRTKAVWFILVAIFFTAVSGLYYKRKIGGVTGDCFGATTQITEVAIYMMGAVLA